MIGNFAIYIAAGAYLVAAADFAYNKNLMLAAVFVCYGFANVFILLSGSK